MQQIENYARIDLIFLLIIIACMTYLTRAGGYLVLSRFSRISPRVEAALEAVPAAVITAIVVPPAAFGGPAEILAILVAGAAAMRFAALPVLLAGLGTLVVARGFGL